MDLTEKIIQWGAVIGASLAAAVMDIRTRRIPNRLCFVLFIAGLIWSASQGSVSRLMEGLCSAAVLAFPFVLLFLLAGGGAGDAKLTAAIGCWLNIKEALIALACISIAGGILGFLVALYKKRLKITLLKMALPLWDWVAAILGMAGMKQAIKSTQDIDGEKLTVPYGVAIFVGVSVAGGFVLL